MEISLLLWKIFDFLSMCCLQCCIEITRSSTILTHVICVFCKAGCLFPECNKCALPMNPLSLLTQNERSQETCHLFIFLSFGTSRSVSDSICSVAEPISAKCFLSSSLASKLNRGEAHESIKMEKLIWWVILSASALCTMLCTEEHMLDLNPGDWLLALNNPQELWPKKRKKFSSICWNLFWELNSTYQTQSNVLATGLLI